MKKNLHQYTSYAIASFIVFVVSVLPTLVTAEESSTNEFVPLVGVPFVDTTAKASLSTYANSLYIAAISLGAVIAVLKIIFAGVKYMLTEIVPDKSQAKKDIKGALLGLILIIGAVLILNTINPTIANITALQDLPDLTVDVDSHDNTVTGDSNVAGYYVEDCPLLRTSVRCKTWCEETMGGTYLVDGSQPFFDLGIVSDITTSSLQCKIAYVEQDTYDCTDTGAKDADGASVYSCDKVITVCEKFDGTASVSKTGASIDCIDTEDVLTRLCPEGDTTCTVSACNQQGEQTWLGSVKCEEQCVDKNGIYDSQTDACVISSTVNTQNGVTETIVNENLYKQYITPYLADPTTYNTNEIKVTTGASEVLFVVTDPTKTQTIDITGIVDQYSAQCKALTGSDNLVKVGDNYACLN